MTDSTTFRQASDLLWTTWQSGGRLSTGLSDALRPTSRKDGYAIQALLDARSASPIFGWKIAATSTAGQAHIGVDGPLAGRILAERVHPDGATLSLANNLMRVAECEFAFRMGRTLLPRVAAYTRGQVLEAVASLHPAIEVPDSRYEAFEKVGVAQLAADNACAHDFLLGAPTQASWRGLDLVNFTVEAVVNDGHRHIGKGENVLGDPVIALVWLANELSSLGIPLEAGQVVTTGTCVKPIPVSPGDEVKAAFGELGRISVRFA
ncbi:hydratase [Pigmentiphaga aceris]|uniref:Hydratase n=1 Tax=Pigmentiphaga aceris TaxID=1940612 RepID=A0A5C0ASY0_9BURK|nr:fumarylacetoacetate hydrolase family protein [Pigmentiphaga aceris]QEI04734.1 hydratase [Pigmentiphaga aceris]